MVLQYGKATLLSYQWRLCTIRAWYDRSGGRGTWWMRIWDVVVERGGPTLGEFVKIRWVWCELGAEYSFPSNLYTVPKSLFGWNGSVLLAHTNNHFPPFWNGVNKTAGWRWQQPFLRVKPFDNGKVATSSISTNQAPGCRESPESSAGSPTDL